MGPDGITPISPEDFATVTDACGVTLFLSTITSVDCSDIGNTLSVTVYAIDAGGNTSSCTTTLTVVDTDGPVFEQGTLPGDQIRQADPNTGTYILEDFTVGVIATDNCTDGILPLVVAQDPDAGTALGVGVYDITLSAIDDQGNLTDYVFTLVVNFLGVNDNSINNANIKMYPNPMKDMVILSNPSGMALNKVAIYDIMGRLIKTVDLKGMGTEKSIQVSELASATYMIIISGENGQITKQLIKE